jgi:hypothetical protein
MQGEDIIRIFLEQYTTQLDFLVSAGTCHPPSIEEGYVTKVRYQFVDVDLGLELSLEVRDVVVDSFIVLLPDAVQPDVVYFGQSRLARLFLASVLENLTESLSGLSSELKQWKSDVEKHYKKVIRSFRSLKMPEAEVVRELFRTDAQWVAHFLRQYREEIIRYARNYWGL